jgi:Uma2 family endonuclease
MLGFLLATRMQVYGEAQQQGQAAHEQLFLILVPDDPERQRRPDAAFVSYQRWPADRPLPHTDPWPVVPDLAAEVVSKSNPAEEMLEKMADYFQAGVQLVWLIYPRRQQVYVYESPTQVRILAQADELDGGAVLPGFRLPLASLFGVGLQQPTT